VKGVHLTELRGYIDTLRTRHGLAAMAWTDATVVAGTTAIKAIHILELRSALSAAYVASGRTAPSFQTTVTASSTLISMAVIAEIRAAIVVIY